MDKKKGGIHKNHRARMKKIFRAHELDAFSDVEKLEFILFFAIPMRDTNPLAHKLLDHFGSFDKVIDASYEELCAVDGVGQHSAMLFNLIHSIISIYGSYKNSDFIPDVDTAKTFAKNLFMGKTVEEFYVICLSTSNKVVSLKLINRGTVSEVPIRIREITDACFAAHCERMIIMHNHPLGVARPSDEDVTFTLKIVYSCLMNDIEVIDHVICGSNGDCFSFEASGILRELKQDALNKMPGSFPRGFANKSTNYKHKK